MRREPVRPGQESVWDYPRPPRAEPCRRLVRIEHGGGVVAESRRTVRLLETSHPPSYYFPRDDIAATLRPSGHGSFCEWKGDAAYVDVVVAGRVFADVGWSYPRPSPGFEILRDHVAFYAGPFEACFVDGERVTPQPGGFYGGWITADLAGPFKGVPGSRFW